MELGTLDATQHGSVAQEYGVQGYPTIKYFAPGSLGNVSLVRPLEFVRVWLGPIADTFMCIIINVFSK